MRDDNSFRSEKKSPLINPDRITYGTRSYSCSALEPTGRAVLYPQYSPIKDERIHLLGTTSRSGEFGAPQTPSQGSVVTIFSIWSTMVGTTILTIPWAISQAGFAVSIGSVFALGLITFYPIYLMLQASVYVEQSSFHRIRQFSEVCSDILGQKAAIFGNMISMFNLLGDMICYWIMLSSLLFEIGCYFYENSRESLWNLETNSTVFDAEYTAIYWNESSTVPIYLVLLLFPFICLRYPTFFTKFSSVGSLAIAFLFIFVAAKMGIWGINVSGVNLLEIKPSYPSVSGTLSAGYLVHNMIVAMTAYHSRPQHKIRDTGIAFCLVAFTYVLLGGGYYLAFPKSKSGISDNFLRDFEIRDSFAFVARLLVFFQMVTLFPLLAYVFRVQFFATWMRSTDVRNHFIIILNLCLVAACLLFASLYPRIGDILRTLGAFCGLVYVCLLPFLIQLTIAYKSGHALGLKLSVFFIYFLLGATNFVSQFVVNMF